MRASRASALTGVEFSRDRAAELLRRLGLEVQTAPTAEPDIVEVGCPTFRPDLEREVDLIEEVIRLHGFDKVPATLPVLQELGVLADVQAAGFLPEYGATMVWGTATTPWSWYFGETNQTYPHAYQVWRPHFDQLLLDNSRRCGVDVREGHQVRDVLFEAGRAVGVRYTAGPGTAGTVRAGFVVDASGQGAILGRKLGLRRWDPFFHNLAVYGYFTGAQRLPAPDETNIFIESYAPGWFSIQRARRCSRSSVIATASMRAWSGHDAPRGASDEWHPGWPRYGWGTHQPRRAPRPPGRPSAGHES
jgi:2-polyprenyl-6-methoxyphenol hydroxylase-like FAD-dependent oxidoreductase